MQLLFQLQDVFILLRHDLFHGPQARDEIGNLPITITEQLLQVLLLILQVLNRSGLLQHGIINRKLDVILMRVEVLQDVIYTSCRVSGSFED